MTACPECGVRKVNGKRRTRCQACERKAVHGPIHQPACVTCRDLGTIDAGGCDIPGCRHYRYCACAAGRALDPTFSDPLTAR